MAKASSAEIIEFDSIFGEVPDGEYAGSSRSKRGDGYYRVVSDTDHSNEPDLDEDEAPFTVDEAAAEMAELVNEAVDFINSEMMPEWEDAQEFYDGESDVERVKGRSQVTETTVRDTIRALKPSIMRVLTQADKIAEYEPVDPTNEMAGAVADQQSLYINQRFWTSGGYKALLDAVHDTLLKKNGILKTYYCEKQSIEYMSVDGMTVEEMENIRSFPDVTIMSEEIEQDGLTEYYSAELMFVRKSGDLVVEYVPLYSFFIDDAATSFHDFKVCGQQTNMPIGDALDLGLEYDDLIDLDGEDVEVKDGAGESQARRKYVKRGDDDGQTSDPMMRRVLITEAYARFDLLGVGFPQTYRFYLGGTGYTYLAHKPVSETPYSNICADPIPGTFFGNSVYDTLMEDQNTQTSLLRATCDNAHLANNKRLGVHESLVNMDDVLNNTVGYPIRFKAPGMIQEIGVQSSIGAMLPLLQHLDMKSNTRVGVTDAAMGLDPDALQSTDKDAVRNTIQLSQGQVELITRNIVETGLMDVFRKLLKLSMRHLSKSQVVRRNSSFLPVDQSVFDPNMTIKTCVGIGTASFEMKLMGLQQVMAQQKEIVATFGWDNPVVPVQKMFNTIADITVMMGLGNVGRYFTSITPEQAAEMQKKLLQQTQKPDPTAAIVKAEEIRGQSALQKAQIEAQTDNQRIQIEHADRIMKIMMDDDLSRDEMLQKLEIEAAKLGNERVKVASVVAAQRATKPGQG